jgi:hypothetical protein
MGLKVFDLQCANLHVFEGWFSSHEDYDSQQRRGLVQCPVCQNDKIEKRLSAPRLNVGHYHETSAQSASSQSSHQGNPSNAMTVASSPVSSELVKLQAAVLQQMRDYVRKTENVGSDFADEARRIHEGEAVQRPIRGTATQEERESLIEEGIAVMPIPDFLDNDRLQ